jgi:hypothetical protein
MTRFTLAPKQRRSNGWSSQQLVAARMIIGPGFDPQSITPEDFIDQRKQMHLNHISKEFCKSQNGKP